MVAALLTTSGHALEVPTRGFVSVPYQLRTGGGHHDHDLYGVAAVDLGDAGRHLVTGHLFGRLSYDLDGDQTGGADPFRSVDDAGARPVEGRVYEAFLDGHRLPGLAVLRLGRQTLHETPLAVHLDGARAESAELSAARLSAGVFGGRPVHLYEDERAGDAAVGGFLQMRRRALWATRVRADVLHIEDENLYGEPRNRLESLRVWQRLGPEVRVHAAHDRLDGEPRSVRARTTWRGADLDLLVRGHYALQLRRERALVSDLDPLSAVLLDEAPYHRFGVLASKGVGAHFSVEGGYDGRRLVDAADEGPFNRAYHRYHLTGAARDLGWAGASAGVTGELWDGGGRTLLAAGGELGYRRRGLLRARVGTAYALYEDDVLLPGGDEDVRSYYARLDLEGPHGLELGTRYQLDDASGGLYHLLRVTSTWRF